jgi:tetratricopeptide (TPR) repeat protein
LLEAALAQETDAFLRSRYMFYLGQSFRDCGEPAKAADAYLQRAEMGFWAQEVFVALYQAGQLREALGAPFEEVLAIYNRASAAAPDRAEALHAAAKLCRHAERFVQGYEIAKPGLGMSPPAEGLFVEPWIYEYGLLDEYAVNAYWAAKYQDCLEASLRILACETLPETMRGRVVANARFAADHWPAPPPPPPSPNLGRLGGVGFIEQHELQPARHLRARLPNHPPVLLAILAKQTEVTLPLYLDCIEALDYPKSAIFLHIRTNNNTDATETILCDWVDRVGALYAGVEFDATDVSEKVQEFGVHEWNPTRFDVLGRLRQASLQRTLALGCDFYFVVDADNFILPWTLRELVALNLPIVAPFLRLAEPGSYYANFHAETDERGYFAPCDQYEWLINRWVRGVVEVPVVHTTYLVRADVIAQLYYRDGSDRHEYVVFAQAARDAGVPQYLDNRQVYGYLTFDSNWDDSIRAAVLEARREISPQT